MQGTGPLREGEVIGGAYRVVTPIGRGGMGTVYRAIELSTQRPIALKVMLSGALTPVRLARFEREAELAARLDRNHGIARVYAYGLHRGLPFIAMELVEGQDLEALLDKGPLPVDRACASGRRPCGARRSRSVRSSMALAPGWPARSARATSPGDRRCARARPGRARPVQAPRCARARPGRASPGRRVGHSTTTLSR